MKRFLSSDQFKTLVKDGGSTDDVVVRKQYLAEVKAEPDGSRILTFTISDSSVDRAGDMVSIDGWELANYRKNPVVLWAHDYTSLPIAKSLNEWKDGNALKARVEWTPAGLLKFNDAVFDLYKGGFLSAVSVGFQPKKWAWTEDSNRKYGIDFEQQELLEFSAVPVPANPNALIEARSAGIDMAAVKEWAALVMGDDSAAVLRRLAELSHQVRMQEIERLR